MVPIAESPYLYLAATIDLERAVPWLAEVNAQRQRPVGCSWPDCF